MKTILITGHDAAYKPLADITVPRMAEYAERHGYDFTCHTKPLLDVPNGIYWTGVCGALGAFKEGYEKVIYLDCDQLVTNYDFELPKMQFGFHASQDWGEDAIDPWQFSMCGITVNANVSYVLEQILRLEPDWRNKPFPEQGPMQHLIKRIIESAPCVMDKIINGDGMINIHPRKMFNAVPDQVCPGKVPEPWQRGDFAAHITMVGLDRRIEIAKALLSQL